MKDQVDQLKAMGIKATFLNSSLTKKQQKEIEDDLRKGHIQFYMLHQNVSIINIFKFIKSN